MNKETKKKLLAPFPKEVVQDPPKGKFGKFVNHAVYVERLRDCDVDYEWEFEPIIINDKVIGAIGKLTIDGKVYQGAGDVEAPALARATTGECLKLAESDAFKRASMRAGLGVELWSGTDDFYMEDTTQPIQKTGRVKDIVIEKEEQEALNKAKQNFAKDVGAEEDSVSDQLNDILEGMCPDKQIRSELKKKSYDKCIEQGMSKEVDDWSDDEMKMQCPDCKKFESVVDNREKKNSDPKFAKIPDFACDNYGADKDGCGKGWWIGGDDFPFEKWL